MVRDADYLIMLIDDMQFFAVGIHNNSEHLRVRTAILEQEYES